MPIHKIMENIYSVGAIDWDRTLFDALIPLPYGTSYNAYLIRGSKKTALIDTVEPAKWEDLKQNLSKLNVDKIDYVVSNHAEQDHSGSLPHLLDLYPESVLITGKKGRDMLVPLLDLNEERIQIIEDREELSLGDKTLQFIFAPWVHWPETMFTYLKEDEILFSCDLFGSHLASSHLYASRHDNWLPEAKRYYAEIMMPFASRIVKHLETISRFPVKMIAPSHGPVHDKPDLILQYYQQWVSEEVKNEVILIYASMHGSTENLTMHLTDALIHRGVRVMPFNTISADIGEIALALVDAATVVVASPAILMGLHPNIVYATYIMNSLKPKTRFAGLIGSYGWAHKMVDQLKNLTGDLKVELLEPVLIKGYPTIQDYEQIDHLAELIAEKHRSAGINGA
ncbi:MAG: FprA family A-type flavoprotein [Calditrichaeota bacterium]|nr:FprA family A-type flavoprotein [Calditrichota bacterium]RQV92568.1 MAG: FprA family A-type flavoprotein [bacterium]RQV99642.1 MAG: FprA family A-type flavoprotein [Calditrichota bacterium]